MKIILLLCTILFAPCLLTAQSVAVAITPDVQTVSVGQKATFSIVITPVNGFNQTVFLSVSAPTLIGSISLPSSSPNPPYANIHLDIIPFIQDTGTKIITIRAKNIGFDVSATCTLIVKNNPQWTAIKAPQIRSFPYCSVNLTLDHLGDVCLLTNETDTFSFTHFRNQKWENYEFWSTINMPSTSESHFRSTLDNEGHLWLASSKGLMRYDGNYMSAFNHSNTDMNSMSVQSVDIDKNGYPICIGSENLFKYLSLERFNGAVWKPRILNAYDVSTTAGFCVDSSNQVWIPSERMGIYMVRNDDIITGFNVSGSTNRDTNWQTRISKVRCDKDGRVWCMFQTMYRLAVSYLDGSVWKNIPTPQMLRTSEIPLSFIVDSDKNVWLTTNDALFWYNGTTWTEFNKTNSPLPSGTEELVQDKYGNIWMLIGDTFYIYNPNGLVRIPLAPTAVEEQPTEATSSIRISPNPARSLVNISGLQGVSSLKIVNLLGETIIEIPRERCGNSEHEINVSGLASGLYILQIRTATDVISKQIVVHH